MTSWGLVVPVYNEADRIDEYIPQIASWATEHGVELVIADDGSNDGTPDRVEELLAGTSGRVLRQAHAGKGAAAAAGLVELRAEARAFCDLDLSTPLADVARLLRLAERAPLLAIGSRDVLGSSLPAPEGKLRETLGRAYNRLLQLLFAPGIVDTQCGAKAADASVWAAVLPHCIEPGFAWDAEVVATALRLGIAVREVPVTWTHDRRTRVHVLRDGAAMISAATRIARRRPPPPNRGQRATASTSELAVSGHGREMIDAGPRHWWFRSRAALVATALRRCEAATDGLLIDVGAGPGWVTPMVGWSPESAVAVEPEPGLAAVAARGATTTVCADGGHLPLRTRSCAVVTLLDVLEHNDRPGSLLREARRALCTGGLVVVLVPAHRWLWSATDEVMGHRRRYSLDDVGAALDAAGFEVVLRTGVFAWAVPALVVVRRVLGRVETGLRPASVLTDRLALVLTSMERQLLGRVRMPIGGSVLAVGRCVEP